MDGIVNPGAYENYDGTVVDYTRALTAFRRAIIDPETLGLTVVHVTDQSIETLQKRGE